MSLKTTATKRLYYVLSPHIFVHTVYKKKSKTDMKTEFLSRIQESEVLSYLKVNHLGYIY